MTSHHRRTWQPHRIANVLLTVELEPLKPQLSTLRHRRMDDATQWLLELFDRERLSATWAVGSPAEAAAAISIIRSPQEHELAVLGDPSWIGPPIGRPQFGRELARRVSQARAVGLDVKSLVARAPVGEHLDLLVKHGIVAVAVMNENSRVRFQHSVPRALHYGLWELPVGGSLPLEESWRPGKTWSLLRWLHAAAIDAATCILAIDVPGLADRLTKSQKSLARIARRIAELRDRGLVRVETQSAAAARLSNVPAAKPQRSILRLAA
jgi:hypothetical protein